MSKSQTTTKRVARVVHAKKMKVAEEPKPYNPYRAAAERLHNHPGLEAFIKELEELRRRDERDYLERE